MRLSEYPYITVRIACSRCSRKGSYRLARLADRYGAETMLSTVLAQLAGDCRHRDVRLRVTGYCGAFFPDLDDRTPPDRPAEAKPPLRIVR